MALPKVTVTPGTGQQINTLQESGQNTMVNSHPVVLASDHSPLPMALADGADVTLGAQADAPATTDTSSATLMAFIKRLVAKLPGVGQKAMAGSMSVVVASDQTVPTGIGDGSNVTLGGKADAAATTDTGTFSVVAFIKRQTSSLTTIAGRVPPLGVAAKAASTPVNIASDQIVPVSVSALPLPASASQDGTDATGATQLSGGTGIRGWLSGLMLGIGKQADAPATVPSGTWSLIAGLGGFWASFGTSSDAVASSDIATTSFFGLFRRASAALTSLVASAVTGTTNDTTALAAIQATATWQAQVHTDLTGTQPRAIASNAPSVSQTATMSALNDVVTLAFDGMNTVVFQLAAGGSGATGAATFFASIDGTNFFAVNAIPYAGGAAVGSVTISTAAQAFELSAGGLVAAKMVCTTAFSAATAGLVKAATGHKSMRVGAPAANPVPVTGTITTAAVGLGTLSAVPAGSTNGTALGALPSGAKGARLYLPAGSSATFAVAATAPTSAPSPTFTISASSTGPNWDEDLAGGQMIYVTAVTGSPLFRWR